MNEDGIRPTCYKFNVSIVYDVHGEADQAV